MKFNINYFVISILFLFIIFKVLYFNILLYPTLNENEWIKLYNNYNFNLNLTYFKAESDKVNFSNQLPIFYSVFLIPTIKISLKFVIYFQTILSSVTAYIFYQVVKKIYNINAGLIFVLLFLFFPLNFHSNFELNEITIFLFLFSIYLYLSQEFINNEVNIYKILIYTLISFLLSITKSGFIIIYLNTLFFFLIYKIVNLKNILISILVFILFSSPLILRNVSNNYSSILLTNNLGINLWKSWNALNTSNIKNINSLKRDGKSDLLSDKVIKKIENLEKDIYWESEINKIYFDETIEEFKKNKLEFIKIYFGRIFSLYFWFINHDFPKANHFIIVLPWLFVILNFLIFFKTKKNNFISSKNKIFEKLIIFIIGIYTLTLPIFNVIPMNKLIIFPLVCIFASENIFNFYKKKVN